MVSARIMIVEDNTAVAEDCRECLESCHFSVTSIRALGEDAVEHAGKERPDAVLMDIKLRGDMDGIEAAARIHDRYNIPIVFLSAYSDNDLLQRAKQVGSFGYLVKPFDERELFTTLELALYKARSEKQRLQMEARLQEVKKMEAIGQLAGGIAHDLNNMLSIILGYTQAAMEAVDSDGTVYQDLGEVFVAAQRSSGLIKQLLTFASKQIITPKVIDLNVEIEKMITPLNQLVGDQITLAWHPISNLWLVEADPAQIEQILYDLCKNAKDAICGNGRITIKTGMAVFDPASCPDHEGNMFGEFVFLTVSDDGHGMDKETLARLFEPFFTTRKFGRGTGLGLATIHGIVKQNNGFITVYSEPGKGATFNIYLPRHLAGLKDRF